MDKSSISVVLMIFLFGSGNLLTMKRGFVADHVNITGQCTLPQSCTEEGFTDWYKVGDRCVKYFKEPLNFTNAEFSCGKKHTNAHLVSVHDSSQNDFLFCIVEKSNPGDLRIWLGGFELFQTDVFLWIDGSHWDYDRWICDEPKHLSTEECLEMNWKEKRKWNDDSCFVKKNYICAFK